VPLAWRAERVAHARLYYALHALQREDLHGEAFDTIHRRSQPLNDLPGQLEFVKARGIDTAQFATIFNSAAVDREVQHGNDLAKAYRVAVVPSLGIAGKYLSDVPKVGSEHQLVLLLNDLIAREVRR